MTTKESADPNAALPGVFDVRHWLAAQLASTAADLVLVSDEVDWAGRGSETLHANASSRTTASRPGLLISPARTFLKSEPPQRTITATWPGGEAATTIAAEVAIRA